MDRKTFSIGILSITAVVLFVASLATPPSPAKAEFAVKDLQGWQLLTVASQAGGDVLYVIDPNGKVIVLAYDLAQKVIKPVGSGDLATLLAGGK